MAHNKGQRPVAGHFQRKDYSYDYHKYVSGGTLNRELLLADARKVAKATNQRLLRLEKAGATSAGAYRGAVKALSGLYDKTNGVAFGKVTKEGKPRYKENVKGLSNEELLHMLYTLGKTQTAKTSTVACVKETYGAGMENLNKLMSDLGLKSLSLNEVMELFKDKALQESTKLYGYRAVLQMMDEAKAQGKDPKKSRDKITEALSKGISLNDLQKSFGMGQLQKPDIWEVNY